MWMTENKSKIVLQFTRPLLQDPLEMIDQYGADLSRLQLLFEARPSVAIDYPYPYPTYRNPF
jgi:hypothetical protein